MIEFLLNEERNSAIRKRQFSEEQIIKILQEAEQNGRGIRVLSRQRVAAIAHFSGQSRAFVLNKMPAIECHIAPLNRGYQRDLFLNEMFLIDGKMLLSIMSTN
jgi:hypothetical protein